MDARMKLGETPQEIKAGEVLRVKYMPVELNITKLYMVLGIQPGGVLELRDLEKGARDMTIGGDGILR